MNASFFIVFCFDQKNLKETKCGRNRTAAYTGKRDIKAMDFFINQTTAL